MNLPDIRKLCFRKPQQAVGDRKAHLRHHADVIVHQKIKDIRHRSGRRILNGKHAVVRLPFSHGLHDQRMVQAGKFLCFRPEKLHRGFIAISPFHSGVGDALSFHRQFPHHRKPGRFLFPVLHKELILAFPADRHHMGENLLHPLAVKFSLQKCSDPLDFLLLPNRIKDRLPGFYFKFRHILAQFHPPLK